LLLPTNYLPLHWYHTHMDTKMPTWRWTLQIITKGVCTMSFGLSYMGHLI
jgi:hypothetical protein